MNISIAKVFVRQQPNIVRSIMPAIKTESALLPQLVENTLLRSSSSKLLHKTLKTKLGKLLTPLSSSAKEKIEVAMQKAGKKEQFFTRLTDYIKPQKYFSAEYLQNKNTSIIKNFAEHAEKTESSGFFTKIRQLFQKKQNIKSDKLVKELTSEKEKNVIEKGQNILKKQKIKNRKKIKKISNKKYTKINKKSTQVSNTGKEVNKKSFQPKQTSAHKTQEPISKSVETAPKQNIQKDATKELKKENFACKQSAENPFKPTGKKQTTSATTSNKYNNGKNGTAKFKNNQEIVPQKNIVSKYSQKTQVNVNSKTGNHNCSTNPFTPSDSRAKIPLSGQAKAKCSCAGENGIIHPNSHESPQRIPNRFNPNGNVTNPKRFNPAHQNNNLSNPTTPDVKPSDFGDPNKKNTDTNTFGHITLSPEIRGQNSTDINFVEIDKNLTANTTTPIKNTQTIYNKTEGKTKKNRNCLTQDNDIIESTQQHNSQKSRKKINNKKRRIYSKSVKTHKSQLIAEKFNQTKLQTDKIINNSIPTETTKVIELESFAMFESKYGADAFNQYAEKHGLESAILNVLNNSSDVTDASLKTALDKFKKNPHLQEKILKNAKVGEFTKLLELASDSTLLQLKGTTFSNFYQTKLLRNKVSIIEHQFKQCG